MTVSFRHTFDDVPSFNFRSPSNKRFRWWLAEQPGIGAVKSKRQCACTNFSKSSSLVSWKWQKNCKQSADKNVNYFIGKLIFQIIKKLSHYNQNLKSVPQLFAMTVQCTHYICNISSGGKVTQAIFAFPLFVLRTFKGSENKILSKMSNICWVSHF